MKEIFYLTLVMLFPFYNLYSQINIKSGTNVSLKTSVSVAVNGNFINNGTLYCAETSNILFSSSGPQAIQGETQFSNLTKSGTGDLTLSGDIKVNGILTLNGGKINIVNFDLTLGSTGSIINASEQRFISTLGTGSLRRIVGNSDVEFPIGNTTFNPILLNNVGTIDTFSARVQNTFVSPIGNGKVNKQWTIHESVPGGSNVNATLHWSTSDEDTSFIRSSDVYMERWNGSSWNRIDPVLTVNGSGPYSITKSGLSTFGQFALVNRSIKTLMLTIFIQGLYDANTNSTIRDTVRVYLRNTNSPFSIVDSSVAFLSSNGLGAFTFSNASNGFPYYIQTKHRNSIETWSKSPGQIFTNSILSYNFSSNATQAFGSNLIPVDLSPLRFAIYGGDENQDGTVDATDIINVFNDVNNVQSGYVTTDMTGDNFVDVTDLILTFNNSVNVVTKIIPGLQNLFNKIKK